MTLYLCVSYNSTEELDKSLSLAIENAKIDKDLSSTERLEKYLYGGMNLSPDILIRTSGENRLSNFMLYQCRFSRIYFIDKNWPEIKFFDFLKIIFQYHFSYDSYHKEMSELKNS